MTVPEPAERQRRPLTAEKRDLFLAALKEGYSITHAARMAGTARQRVYELREQDEEFAAAWVDAWELGTDVLEDELRRRALGYDEITYDGDGKVLRRVHRFDTPAIVLALKSRRPDLYRDNAPGLDARVSIVLESAFGNGAPVIGEVVDGEARELPEGES